MVDLGQNIKDAIHSINDAARNNPKTFALGGLAIMAAPLFISTTPLIFGISLAVGAGTAYLGGSHGGFSQLMSSAASATDSTQIATAADTTAQKPQVAEAVTPQPEVTAPPRVVAEAQTGVQPRRG